MLDTTGRNKIDKLCSAYDFEQEQSYQKDIEESCQHNWVRLGSADDGTTFVRCTRCRIEEEV